MGEIFYRKYGTQTTVTFSLYKLDGTGLKTDAAYASGDVTLSKDEGDEASSTNGFTDEGKTYSLVLTATEMQAARIMGTVVDQSSPQVWLDKTFVIETYGNASAQHAFDMSSATVNLSSTTETQIDNIETDTNELQGLISSSKIAAQVKGIDDIDLSTTMKASVNTEVDNALNTAIPGSPTSDSVNERIATMDAAYTATRAGYLDNINNTQLLNISATILGRIDAAISTRATVDTILNEALAGHSTADSAGLALKNLLKIGKNKWAYSGTTFTIFDNDGTTPLYTFTLDSATAPTSRTPA